MEADPTEACLFWACPFWTCPFWTCLGGLGGFDGLVAAFIMNVAQFMCIVNVSQIFNCKYKRPETVLFKVV